MLRYVAGRITGQGIAFVVTSLNKTAITADHLGHSIGAKGIDNRIESFMFTYEGLSEANASLGRFLNERGKN